MSCKTPSLMQIRSISNLTLQSLRSRATVASRGSVRLSSTSTSSTPSALKEVEQSSNTSKKSETTKTQHPETPEPNPSTHSSSKPATQRLSITEQDALLFRQLDDREGSGAGNEIVDGEYEKGMTKYTRANQYRVI